LNERKGAEEFMVMFQNRTEAVNSAFPKALDYYKKSFNDEGLGELVYHYTDITGFRGIIQNQEFWMSNINFMNDKEEFLNGIIICREIIDALLSGISAVPGYDIANRYLKTIQEVLYNSNATDTISHKDIYAMSFCKEGDLLSQWRGYGKENGISIGFDTKKLKQKNMILNDQKQKSFLKKDLIKADRRNAVRLQEVIYRNEIKNDYLKDMISFGLENAEVFCENNMYEPEYVANQILDLLFGVCPIFKNGAFFSEEECRLIYISHREQELNYQPVEYREKHGIIIPFIRFQLVDERQNSLKQWPIEKIIVGPNARQEELADGIKFFLTKQDLEYLVDKVELSPIPFRK